MDSEGLTDLIGQRVTIFCLNYIYTGKLMDVQSKFVLLSDAAIVYETGAFDTTAWQDAQKLPQDLWYVATGTIESFGILK